MSENGLKPQLKNILERHAGRCRAITARELCLLLGQPDRTVRLVIRELRKEGFPVLSSGEGYYLPSTWDELDRWARSMRSRLIEDALTRTDVLTGGVLFLKPAKQARLL